MSRLALIGNYTVLSKHPGRGNGGGATGEGMNPGEYAKNSRFRARFTSADWDSTSGVPYGYRPPGAWIMPQSPGALSAFTTLTGSGALAAAAAAGKNAEATLTGSGDLTATGALIVSAVATLTGSGDIADANAVAFLNAAATLAGSGSISGALTALGNAVATLNGSGTITPTINAIGELAADLTPFTELSPQSLAAAVWEAVAAEYTAPDTFGGQVGFLYLLAHHKVVTDPVGGTMTIYDTDGTTVLFQADLFQDAAGTTPYAGTGAERRDRFV